MPTAVLICVFCSTLIFTSGAAAQTDTTKRYYDYSLVKIRKGIYASRHPEHLRHYVEGNFTFIEHKDGVVVVDATGSPQAARKVLADIKLKINKPVTHLVNTHFHGDHTFGNQEFLKHFPDVRIVATRYTADIIQRRVKTFVPFTSNDSILKTRIEAVNNEIREIRGSKYNDQKLIDNLVRYRDFDLNTVKEVFEELVITPPNLAFDSSTTLTNSPLIKSLFLGKGDTPGDAWVFLPDEKILITGDAVVHPIPYGFSKSPGEWLATLKKARALDFEILIPGHGEIQHGKKYIDLLINTIENISGQVKAGKSKGLNLEEIRNSLKVSSFETHFTNDDKLLQYYFNEYFIQPLTKSFFEEPL